MGCWMYQGKCLEEKPEGVFGFVYLIRDKVTDKIYVGKKQFTYSKKKKIAKSKRIGRKRVERVDANSGWLKYWGSSKELKNDVAKYGEDRFVRHVLRFAYNKTELAYYEVVCQIEHDVMVVDSYNAWISCRIFKKYLV